MQFSLGKENEHLLIYESFLSTNLIKPNLILLRIIVLTLSMSFQEIDQLSFLQS